MKSIILLFFILVQFNLSSQELKQNDSIQNSGLSTEDLTLACENYKKMIDTEAYLEHVKATKLYSEKMGDAFSSKDFSISLSNNKEDYYRWLEKNLTKTKFRSLKEAIEFIENTEKKTEKMVKENEVLFKLIDKATVEQRMQIMKPFFDRNRKELLNE